MLEQVLLLLFVSIPFLPFSLPYTTYNVLNQRSSLAPPEDVLISSPAGTFTAGFYSVGKNAYCFAIWLTKPLVDGSFTVVWMVNRDQPVNGRNTKFSLLASGNLVLIDAGQIVVWTSGTATASSVQLKLHDNGNLVLCTNNCVDYIWQSFDSPTNTLLPQQQLTRNTKLRSSRSPTNHSSGFYKLYFDSDNVLRLSYDGVEITSVFWPPPWLNSWQAGRSTYNDSKVASLDEMGKFVSSDSFNFKTSDYGFGPLRRVTLDYDGNVRAYSLDTSRRVWNITWQATLEPCKTHGICGANGMCTYSLGSGPRCSCMPGYKMANTLDWSEGCIPDFKMPCNDSESTYFLQLPHVEFYGYDIGYYQNYTLPECQNLCLSYCSCKGFQYKFEPANGFYSCFPKILLFNGYQSVGFEYWIYLKLPKGLFSSRETNHESNIQCNNNVTTTLTRTYEKRHEHGWLKSLLWCTGAVGAFEIMCLLIFLYKTLWPLSASDQGYHQASIGFKRFTYAELKKASSNFCDEIGRGGSGIVYKGVLSGNRVVAIKCLYEVKQGEAEFLAEVGLIGRLNHANLIEAWGYCAEGNHRLLVYEYAEHGSLAENLQANNLDWRQRFDIALGTAKGLAYLHEECLEWVLHCDVKPHNILLDSSYQPKVADFGLSKLLKREMAEQPNVSRIRGTRGYMAPEWVFHHPITSKVDVYSYGIVVLEMIMGQIPKGAAAGSSNRPAADKSLTSWVREIVNGRITGSLSSSSWLHQIVDTSVRGEYEVEKLEALVKVALQCTQENKDARPTMKQAVDMLLE